MNKLHSPSSSITSQRKLEWDSLADVGYANESDRKTSASSLSTLERLALKQQYSNNDTQQSSNLGIPTAHSTPLDENEAKSKSKKGVGKKSTKIYKKDIDVVEVNVPHSSNMNPAQSINVNLTKHISFNVEKDGKVTVDNVIKDIRVSPEKVSMETESSPLKIDREMQTSLTKTSNVSNIPDNADQQKIPILISLNTLRSRVRRKRLRMARRKLKTKKRADKENIPVQEKSGEQLSEAESFEYMPGHIYNQNQMTAKNRPANTTPPVAVDNKSSLESSGILTSESSKGSKHSFTKDLEKSIDLLKSALKQRCDDSTLRKQLIQQLCQRLMSSRYRDDESTTDFLSGLSFSSKKLDLSERNNTTTSTSDANNSAEKSKRPKKSILRTDKFNSGSIASTSQSVPNLPVASKSENLVTSNLAQNLTTSNTESDISSKGKNSSDNGITKTTSEELYKKYLQALKREEAYKKHLKDKEMFLKQKLASSDGAFKVPSKVEVKPSNRLKDLINDLTRNNYDDGSGDASKLEGGPGSSRDLGRFLPNRAERSHSVFTLSSGMSDGHNKKPNLKKKLQSDIKELSQPGPSKDSHYCCCPHHGNLKLTDSSVQVNIKNPYAGETCPARQNKLELPKRSAKIISDDATGNIKYVCLCRKNVIQEAPDDFLIYKCSRLDNKGIQLEETTSKCSNEAYVQCNDESCTKRNLGYVPSTVHCLNNKSSQTNMLTKMLDEQPTSSLKSSSDQKHIQLSGKIDNVLPISTTTIYESTRWIQTEISINPKISDPTLSDINIVNDSSCAKLISEHCREIPKSSVTDLLSNQAVASTSAFSNSFDSVGTSKNIGKTIQESNIYDETEKNAKENINQEANIEHSENFTIPIHGTNMTLMVSIGSERPPAIPIRNTKQMITECIGTDKISAIEQATSLREECSKQVQSENISEGCGINYQSKIDDGYPNKTGSANKPLMVNTFLTAAEVKFGTYPKNSPVNERKPFRRANTDTDKVQSITITQNVREEESTPTKYSFRTKSPDISSEFNQNLDACPCGCKGKRDSCKLSCTEQKLTQNRKLTLEKEISTQLEPENSTLGDLLNEQNERCSCGCGGSKNACTESCKELKLLTKQCGTRLIEQSSTQTNNSTEQFDRDGGEKDKCQESCKERKSSLRNDNFEKMKSCGTQPIDNETNTELSQKGQCGIHSLEKKIDSQTNTSVSQGDKCSCGCGGTKSKCKKSCKECKSSSKNGSLEIKKSCITYPSDRHIDTQTDMSPTHDKKCSCGCGGFKDQCKKSCRKLKSSPRNGAIENTNPCTEQPSETQIDKSSSPEKLCESQSLDKAIETQTNSLTKYDKCSCGCDGEKDKCKKSCKEARSSPRKDRKQTDKREIGTQIDPESPRFTNCRREKDPQPSTSYNTEVQNTVNTERFKPLKIAESTREKTDVTSSDNSKKTSNEAEPTDLDPILNFIQNITKKYTKKEVEKGKRKKCFKEIMTVLNYLLDTDESPDEREPLRNRCESSTTAEETDIYGKKVPEKSSSERVSKKLVDKEVQPPKKTKTNACNTESSELPTSTDIPGTSSDSGAYKVLNKIKNECEKYHQRRCKIHSGNKCDGTSSTSMNCDQCRRAHNCQSRSHKCKNHKKSSEKIQKSPVAYNLILQTSESVISEGPSSCQNTRTLKNIIVKVPKKKPNSWIPFRELTAKFEKQMSCGVSKDARCNRSKSLPNEEISSMDEIIRKSQGATVREYLEKNRPDFIEKCSQRQTCMRYISESR